MPPPQLPSPAIHLPRGDVLLPAATFAFIAQALPHMRHAIARLGGDYAEIELADQLQALLGFPDVDMAPLPPAAPP